jgi:putative aldouronate transport system permease protein
MQADIHGYTHNLLGEPRRSGRQRGGLAGFFRSFIGYKKYFALTVMILPTIVYFIIFKYGPMYGLGMAFTDYKPNLGMLGSPWIGFENFEEIFSKATFGRAMRNTIIISLYKLVAGFPMPIILALILNEVRHLMFKKVVQTISYLPYFLSWVVLAGVFIQLLSPSTGLVNYILKAFGLEPIYFLGENKWFRSVLVATDVWKNMGWNSIIFIAAIASVEQSMYEAAVCDGANRFQRMWHITLPNILPTITVLLILNIGHLLDAGFDQVFNLYNGAVYETSDILDTYVYRLGIGDMQYGLATAVGLFKNVIGFLLVVGANIISKKLTDSGIW